MTRLVARERCCCVKMPETCVAFGCSNVWDKDKGIKLHPIPFYGSDDPQKRKRRKKWVDWIQSKRAHWQPSQFSHVCSDHFVCIAGLIACVVMSPQLRIRNLRFQRLLNPNWSQNKIRSRQLSNKRKCFTQVG